MNRVRKKEKKPPFQCRVLASQFGKLGGANDQHIISYKMKETGRETLDRKTQSVL